jgi:hypothetical protein
MKKRGEEAQLHALPVPTTDGGGWPAPRPAAPTAGYELLERWRPQPSRTRRRR